MNKYKMVISYDGTDFSGWQIQPHASTIQETIQDKLSIIFQKPITIIGSGRTDAGVHAIGQVAHFWAEEVIDPRRLRHSLNGLLPPTIRILLVAPVRSSFHAQKSAYAKVYHYHICTHEVPTPFQYRTMFHPWRAIDWDVVWKAAQKFVGERDFTSFSNEPSAGAVAKNPVRHLYRIDVVEHEEGIRLELEANGFLYKMVRNIVGTLLEVGAGKRSIDEIDKIFQAKDRRKAGRAAPAKGLFLFHVFYPLEEETLAEGSL